MKTSKGSISVFVCGDQEKPALITYPDVGLNCMLRSVIVLILMVDANFYIFLEVALVGSCISIQNMLTVNEALIY